MRHLVQHVVLLLVAVDAGIGLESCRKRSPCSCESDEGLIDLSPLDSKDATKPRFQNVTGDPSSGFVYSYNPCTPFNEGFCVNAEICEVASHASVVVGIHSKNEFLVEGGLLTIRTEDRQGLINGTKIHLTCNSDEEGIFRLVDAEDSEYSFELVTKHACPQAVVDDGHLLSIGSVLVIVFVISVLAYFLFGMAYRKLCAGASGRDVIPNVDFWADIPNLIKDGFSFLSRGCKSSAGYEEL